LSIITPESRIEVLGLSAHTEECLKEAGVVLVVDLMEIAEADLQNYCDESSLAEIRRTLASHGLHAGEDLA
jgi:hypothetical protein